MYSTRITKNLYLCVSYIFPKFDGVLKNESVMFLVVPPNHTFTLKPYFAKNEHLFYYTCIFSKTFKCILKYVKFQDCSMKTKNFLLLIIQIQHSYVPLTMGIHQGDPFGAFTCHSLFQSSCSIYCDMFCFMFISHH